MNYINEKNALTKDYDLKIVIDEFKNHWEVNS